MLTKLPWLGPLIVFGLVVFVHELGHFIAAKAFRVYAPRFSIGFGPALWRKRWGETEYVLASLPLGGYVRMASRDDETASALEGGNESESLSADDPRYDPAALMPFGPHPVPPDRTFESKPLWQRLIIMVAGVTMNIVLAIVVMSAIAKAAGKATLETRVVGRVEAPSWATGLSEAIGAGDTIVSVGGRRVANWNQILSAIGESPDTMLRIAGNRGTATVPVGPVGSRRREELAGSIAPWSPPVIGTVAPSSPAARGGLRAGDTLVTVGGTPVRNWADMTGIVVRSPGVPVEFTVRRGAETRTLTVRPDSAQLPTADGSKRYRGLVGITNVDIARHEPIGAGEALSVGWRATWRSVDLVVGFLGNLVRGRVSVRELGGPIAITQASVNAAKTGVEELFALLAFLSVNLAVMNLLPIPILDGGQIVMNVAESVKGRPFSMRTKENFARVGLLAIALLFVVVMFNDIRRIAGSAMDLLSRVF
ncbi:MAG TPA: RIP metalloprotease RseP [Gemmatimonadaceae bacterium]|nr:RIP metalloprotease RseP [Gemmatimonadaceae bacterium]